MHSDDSDNEFTGRFLGDLINNVAAMTLGQAAMLAALREDPARLSSSSDCRAYKKFIHGEVKKCLDRNVNRGLAIAGTPTVFEPCRMDGPHIKWSPGQTDPTEAKFSETSSLIASRWTGLKKKTQRSVYIASWPVWDEKPVRSKNVKEDNEFTFKLIAECEQNEQCRENLQAVLQMTEVLICLTRTTPEKAGALRFSSLTGVDSDVASQWAYRPDFMPTASLSPGLMRKQINKIYTPKLITFEQLVTLHLSQKRRQEAYEVW